MGDFFKMILALSCVFAVFFFVAGRGGLDKVKMVKNAEASGLVYIKQVTPLTSGEMAAGIDYSFKVEAELLKPVTGALPNYMYLYLQQTGPSGSADINKGKALVFVNKDAQGRLTLEKGPQDVFVVDDNRIWWSPTKKFTFVRKMPLNTVINDIKSIAIGSTEPVKATVM